MWHWNDKKWVISTQKLWFNGDARWRKTGDCSWKLLKVVGFYDISVINGGFTMFYPYKEAPVQTRVEISSIKTEMNFIWRMDQLTRHCDFSQHMPETMNVGMKPARDRDKHKQHTGLSLPAMQPRMMFGIILLPSWPSFFHDKNQQHIWNQEA